MQAQFDEWVHEQDQSLDEKLAAVKDYVQAEVEQRSVTHDTLTHYQENMENQVGELDNKFDKLVVAQKSSLNPLQQKVEDLSIEIGQKVFEINQQQDQQIHQLVEQIKQIQETSENLQEIVVQNTNDLEGVRGEMGSQLEMIQDFSGDQQWQPELQQVQQQVNDLHAGLKEVKDQQGDLIELASDVTELKIDLQKLRQTQMSQKDGGNG